MPIISDKTRKFIAGRKGLLRRIEETCAGVSPVVWVHSPSYGEFEEARPVIAELRRLHPEYKILVTFFSPSGYEHLKDDPIADFVFYLPVDTPRNARRFLDAVHPVKALFCIADFWLCHLNELRRRGIETYLISGRFNAVMSYFKALGRPYVKAFRNCFTWMFVNNVESEEVLRSHGVRHCSLAGDPRMDRVLALAAEHWSDPVVDAWSAGRKVFVAGSVLPDEDTELIAALANSHPDDKFLVVPHEVGAAEVARLRGRFTGKTALYTEPCADAQVLIVNIVGILSRIYRYGFAAYVGGGFDGAPHSIVEPAAYGIPVCFGPEFGPVWHCRKMIDAGAGFCVSNSADIVSLYDSWKGDPEMLESAGDAARKYCEAGSGVAEKIALQIDEQLWK